MAIESKDLKGFEIDLKFF